MLTASPGTRLPRRSPPSSSAFLHPGRVTHRAWTGWVDEHGSFTPGFLLSDEHPGGKAAAAALDQATAREPACPPVEVRH